MKIIFGGPNSHLGDSSYRPTVPTCTYFYSAIFFDSTIYSTVTLISHIFQMPKLLYCHVKISHIFRCRNLRGSPSDPAADHHQDAADNPEDHAGRVHRQRGRRGV